MTYIRNQLKKIINRFSGNSLTIQVICFETMLILLVALTICIVYMGSTKQIYQQNENYVNDIADQMINNVNTHLVSIENIMYTTTYNRDIHDLLESKDPLEAFYITRKVDAYITQIGNKKREIKKIMVVGADDRADYNTGYDGQVLDQIKLLNKQVKDSINGQYIGTINFENKNHLVFGNSIYSLEKSFKKLGNLLVLVEESIFMDELSSESGDFYIINSQGEIVASYDKECIGGTVDFNDITVKRENWYMKEMNLILVGVNTNQNIITGIKKTWSRYSILIIMMLFMVIMTYLFFTKYAVRPLYKINKFISVISQGDLRYLKKRIDINGSKEIRAIAKEINELLDEVNLLTGRLVTTTTNLYDAELSKKKAELSFLKSQVNPHFLYNTLGTIKGIAIMHNEKKIEVMTGALVKIFRYSIKGEDYVDLFQEIEVVEAYIHIQQHRFINRFDINYNIEEHLMDMPIIKMILQPIIENAIVHGIEPVEQKCTIEIIGVEEERDIKIIVKDNGAGMPEDKLLCLQKQLSARDVKEWETEHIGVLNVHRRLRYAYGELAGICIISEEYKGTTVCLVIPSDQV